MKDVWRTNWTTSCVGWCCRSVVSDQCLHGSRQHKLIGDVPAATAILDDRFLHRADVITITGKSHWLRNQAHRNKSYKDQTEGKNDEKGKADRPRISCQGKQSGV